MIELGAPTHREALEETELWAWLGLGIFNLLFVALAGFMAFWRANAVEPERRTDGRV
ncbi:MAG: hypothetical protein JRI68_00270 [Deltaproteobacteria bacterium]|nr:hypothetical protein [Deltaproteobacteria bacterium]